MVVVNKLIVLGAFLWLGKSFAQQGEPVVYFPPFELRAVPADKTPFVPGVSTNFVNTLPKHMPSQLAQHPDMVSVPSTNINTVEAQPVHKHEVKNSSVSIHDLLSALGIDDHEARTEDQSHSRAASGKNYDYPPYPSYQRPPSAYPRPPSAYPRPPSDYGYSSHGYGASPNYHDSPYAYVPPTYGHHPVSPPPKPLSIFKPLDEKTALVNPAGSKIVSKISGLIGLILSVLTGFSFGDLGELKGLKDLIVIGIIKPLLAAKGSLKSLVGKLAIPVISLLLVNLEMLVVIWWLWEDCTSEPAHPPPAYPYPKPYGYNPYR